MKDAEPTIYVILFVISNLYVYEIHIEVFADTARISITGRHTYARLDHHQKVHY